VNVETPATLHIGRSCVSMCTTHPPLLASGQYARLGSESIAPVLPLLGTPCRDRFLGTDPVRCQRPEDILVHSTCNLHTANSPQGYSNGTGEEQPKRGAHLPALPLKPPREPSTSRTRRWAEGTSSYAIDMAGAGMKAPSYRHFIPVSTQGACTRRQSTSARATVACPEQSADAGSVPKPDTRTPHIVSQ
jgi:hypothetical protein